MEGGTVNFNGIIERFMIVLVGIGFAIGAVLFWLIPLLWQWIKPWLHLLTA